MDLFQEFKKFMPTNKKLVSDACNSLLSQLDKDKIKMSFSIHVQALNDKVYENYLNAQRIAWDHLISLKFSNELPPFDQLDKFFLSLGQSRKNRAGKAFEIILEELLGNRLDYPLDKQVNVDGAKPDFVMPSSDYFKRNPIDCMLLTAKRTLRERWRQVVTEANVTYSYFLATLDHTVSKSQLEQTSKHKIYLVTTKDNILKNEHYDNAGNVLSFEDFISLHLDPAMIRWHTN